MNVIVMAGQGFTDKKGDFHPWGQEYAVPEGKELRDLLKSGTVREDDRSRLPIAPPPEPPEASDATAEAPSA